MRINILISITFIFIGENIFFYKLCLHVNILYAINHIPKNANHVLSKGCILIVLGV